MSIAFLNGHTRAGAISADIVSAGTTTTDVLAAGQIQSNVATYDSLIVNVSATLNGTVTFGGPMTFAGATFNDTATFQNNVTIAAGHTVLINSPTTFDADVSVTTGHSLTINGVALTGAAGTLTVAGRVESTDATYSGDLSATTISGNPTFTDGAIIATGQTLGLSGANISGNPAFTSGLTLTAGAVLNVSGVSIAGNPFFLSGLSINSTADLQAAGATISGNPLFSGGVQVSSGQTVTLAGVSISGNPTFTGSPVLSPGQTLTFTGATLNAGSTGVLTNLTALNGVPATSLTYTGYGGPQRATIAFPRLTLPASGTGIYIIDNLTFTGQAGNGTDPGTVRGGPVATTAGLIGEVDAFSLGLIHFWVFNRSPYTLYLGAPGITGADEQSPSAAVWWPSTFCEFSRASLPSPGDYTGWRVTTQPLNFVSGWMNPSLAILSSSDCTFSVFRAQYAVRACKPSGDALGVRLVGQMLIHFTTAAPTDPVRIQVPLPVGPQATQYPATASFAPAVNFFRDWVVGSAGLFFEDLPAFIGTGELARNLTTYARTDATAKVGVYLEDGDPNVGYARIVVSGFTGGAGTYKLRCNYELQLDNIQYRATFPTFSFV